MCSFIFTRVMLVSFAGCVCILFMMKPVVGATQGLALKIVKPINGKIIQPNYSFGESDWGKELTVRACPGEFEPASFVLYSQRTVESVRIVVSELTGSAGVINAKNVAVKLVKVWYQATGAWNSHRKMGVEPVLVPELLLNDDDLIRVDNKSKKNYLKLSFEDRVEYVSISDTHIRESDLVIYTNAEFPVKDAPVLQPFSLQKEQAKQVWVTVRIPQDAKPGIYRGSISLASDAGLLVQIPFTVEVLPFRLAPSKLVYSLYYRGKLRPELGGTIGSEYKNFQQLRTELRNIRDHGIQNPTVYQLNRNPWELPRLPKKEERALLVEYLALRQHLGFAGQPLYLNKATGKTTSEEALREKYVEVKELLDLVSSFGVTELFLYGKDEAKGSALIEQRSAWKRVHAAGAKIFASSGKRHYTPMVKFIDLLILHGPPSREDAQRVHALGNRIFCYANPPSGPENPLLFRRNYGLTLWQADYDGAMIYAYQTSGSGKNMVWNDFDARRQRDHNFTYPTTDGVIDTLAWEGLREAVDDVRYITTLEKTIDIVLNGKDLRMKNHAYAARRYLAQLKSKKGIDLDQMRGKIIEYLMLMSGPSDNRVTFRGGDASIGHVSSA